MNNVGKYLYNRFVPAQKRWEPIISVYYLNYACEFKCTYCSNGAGVPYYELPDIKVDAVKAFEIIKQIRKYTDYFVLTGGEPLQYEGIADLLLRIKNLKFKNFVFTTNGFYFEKYMDELMQSVDSLVFSLDSMKKEKAEHLWAMPAGTFEKVMENIKLAHDIKKQSKSKKPDLVISSVVTPDSIEDLYEVFEFSKKMGFEFAACPQLIGVKAHPDLYDNDEYRNFYNFLIIEKKKRSKIYGTVKYLEYMRDLRTFKCNPFTMLVVSPAGEIYFPCLEKGHPACNIMDIDNLHIARQKGERKYGPKPTCGNQCHSACALSFAIR